ncbi:MAG: sugar ABC transporter permease [Spirochaetaceae bacterium]|nr:sugar ABC transporter permease [Spirochaetaceae bacterium]
MVSVKPMKKNVGGANDGVRLIGALFMLPAAIMILFCIIIPLVWNLALSFMEWNGNSAARIAGVDNYLRIIADRKSYTSISNSLFVGIVSTITSMGLGIFLALCVYRLSNRESTFCRFVYFCPSMLPTTVIGLLFVFVLAPDEGIVNFVLRSIGLSSLERAWLANPKTVLWTISVVQGWKLSGTVLMLFYTGLIRIPPSLFEAGKLEGITYVQEIKTIILPLLRSTVALSLSMTLLSAFRTYDIVWSMTKGGPGDLSKTVPIRIIETGFIFGQFGYAAALGIVLTVLVGVCIVAGRMSLRGEAYEY